MATISTTTNGAPFVYPGNRLVAWVNGHNRMMALVKASTADNYVFFRSTDSGSSWSSLATVVRANLVDVGSIFCDNYEWLFWAYRTNESSQDRVYFRRMHTSTGAMSGEQLIAAVGNGGVAGSNYSGLDLVTHYNTSTSWHHVVVALGENTGPGLQAVGLVAGTIDPSGVLYDGNYRITGTKRWQYSVGSAGRVGPTIDKEHTGDGYQSTTPNLWITFGRTWQRQVKVPWSGDGWTGGSTSNLITSSITATDTLASKWDGSRFLMAVADPVSTDNVMLVERNRSNSTSTVRRTGSHPTGTIRQCSLTYNAVTQDVRIFAVGTSTAVLYYIDYIRATATWGAWTSTTFTPLGGGVDNWGARDSSYQTASYGLYYGTSGAPNTLSFTTYGLSYPPNTPTWVTPTSGAAADVAVSLPLDWAFSDPDINDTQSAFAVSRQIGAGTLAYWRASDSTWQVAEVQNTSSSTILTLGSGWALASDANYTYKVKTWDASSNASGYSAGMVVVPSTPVNPSISTPTAAQVLATNSVTMTWTAAEQTQYRAILTLTTGGSFQIYDSGWVTDTVSRTFTFPNVLPNSTAYTITFQTKNLEGLASAVQSRSFTVSYTPPATPTTVASPLPVAGVIRVAITNPTPGGSQPAVASQDLYRRVVGDTSTGIRVATGVANNGTVDDWRGVVSGVAYQYSVTTFGVNGTSTSGVFTA